MNVKLIQMDLFDVLSDDLEKLASLNIDISESYNKDDNDFALILNTGNERLRKFAMYTPELTFLNMECLKENLSTLPEELIKIAAQNLTCRATQYNLEIPEELSKYNTNLYTNREIFVNNIDLPEKKEETPQFFKFALENKYPIDTPELIKTAEAWFDKNYYHMNVKDIFTFSRNVYNQANSLNVDLSNTLIEKIATLDTNLFNRDLFYHLKARKDLIPESNNEGKEMVDKLIAYADEIGTEKLAELVEMLDEEYNLKQYYDKNLVHPVLAVFNFEKNAGQYIDDIYVTLDDVKRIANHEITDLVGTDVVKELKGKDGVEVLASLPTPIRKKLLALIVNK